MSDETKKVYVVKKAFQHEGLAYAEGEKYELADSVVASLPEGSVEEFVPEAPTPDAGATATAPAGETSTPAVEEKKEAVPAKPWVGNHTVGQE